jgi:uncharacterized coiled-coil protein SlyX
MTQQQAVDQLQVVQDQLAAQKAETKRLSEQIAAVTAKLEALQQSFAEFPPVLRLYRSPNLAANKSAWTGRPIGLGDSRKGRW